MAEGVELHLERAPDPDLLDQLEQRIQAETRPLGGEVDDFALHLDDERGALVAGLWATVWGGCCELLHLWVDPAWRRRGLAGELLAEAEAEARRRGCGQIVLFTHASQAPGLYERHGYLEVGRVEDYPAGDAARWLRKDLR